MQISRFVDSRVGYLVDFCGTDPRTGREYSHKAFVPNPLPQQVDLGRSTHLAIGQAMLAIGKLDQALRWLANPMLYIRPSIRREAVSTSALEGTFAAFEDVMGADVLQDNEPVDASVAEVLNYVRAAEKAFEWVRERPITRGLVCELQRILVRGTPSDGTEAGQIRRTPVLIGPKGCRVEEARFVPPPPGDALVAGVDDWTSWLERLDDLPLVARVAISHYQFETLHPFTDGNGRIGRLVAMLQFVRAGVLEYPMLNLSTWLHAHKDTYMDHLLEVSATGNYGPWIEFFCAAVREEAEGAVDRITAAQSWHDQVKATIAAHKVRAPAVHRVVDGLVGHPVITPTWIQRHYEVSYPTANSAVVKLQALGILREVTGNHYRRLYAATELLAIFNR